MTVQAFVQICLEKELLATKPYKEHKSQSRESERKRSVPCRMRHIFSQLLSGLLDYQKLQADNCSDCYLVRKYHIIL